MSTIKDEVTESAAPNTQVNRMINLEITTYLKCLEHAREVIIYYDQQNLLFVVTEGITKTYKTSKNGSNSRKHRTTERK